MPKKKPEEEDIDPFSMPKGTRVKLYLRCSMEDQHIESQEEAMLKLVKEKGWVIDKTYRDKWTSGSTVVGRLAFEEMIRDVSEHPEDAQMLALWSFSRFARDLDDALYFSALLRRKGLQILSHEDKVPSGQFRPIYEAMLHWQNDLFLRNLHADTIRGMTMIADHGCVPGGRICRGYLWEPIDLGQKKNGDPRIGRKPYVNPDEAPLVIQAFEMKARGAKQERIAEETGLFPGKSGSWTTLFRCRAVIGEYEFQGKVYTDIYPPIISRELFDAVQAQLAVRPKRKLAGGPQRHHPRRRGSRYIVANLLVCMHCGGPMQAKSVEGHRYYICKKHNDKAEDCTEARFIPADIIERQVLDVLIEQILQEVPLCSLLEWTTEQLNSQLEGLLLQMKHTRKELAEAERLLDRMVFNFGTMERPLRSTSQRLEMQEHYVDELKLRLSELESDYADRHVEATPEQLQKFLQDATAIVKQSEPSGLRALCERLCSRIVVGDGKCRIEVHFPSMIPFARSKDNEL